MKKGFRNVKCVVLCLSLLTALVAGGCAKRDAAGTRQGAVSNDVNSILQKGMDAEDKNGTANPGTDVTLPTGIPGENGDGGNGGAGQGGENQGRTPDGSVDVDLTALSSTMVYAEVLNIIQNPESYIGKTVKMDGSFMVYYDEDTGIYYYACIIEDATACCQNGIEFVPADARKFPEDFPELGSRIVVTGVFDTYQDGQYTYCTLRNAKLGG
ncbi:MAG: hypothetical protein J5795_04105 [Lachnospiraceae bacterium]|nr:hypothetical protein [Lachnospiraceae bacterium]